MVGRLRVCFPKVFELTLVCCSVCTPRLALNIHELYSNWSQNRGRSTQYSVCSVALWSSLPVFHCVILNFCSLEKTFVQSISFDKSVKRFFQLNNMRQNNATSESHAVSNKT